MNWQPQLKYSYHGDMTRPVTICHILLDIMKKLGKKKHLFAHGFSYKERRIMDDIRQEIHNCQGRSFSILMLPGINSPKISNIYLGEFPYIDQCIRSLIMGLELAERVSDSLAR